jgi:hypothetical protein
MPGGEQAGRSDVETEGHVDTSSWFGKIDPMFLGDGSGNTEQFHYGPATPNTRHGEHPEDET